MPIGSKDALGMQNGAGGWGLGRAPVRAAKGGQAPVCAVRIGRPKRNVRRMRAAHRGTKKRPYFAASEKGRKKKALPKECFARHQKRLEIGTDFDASAHDIFTEFAFEAEDEDIAFEFDTDEAAMIVICDAVEDGFKGFSA